MTRSMRRSQQNPQLIAGFGLLAILTVTAVLAPLIAPFAPNLQIDPVSGRQLPPFSMRELVVLADGRTWLAERVEVTDRGVELERMGEVTLLPIDGVTNLADSGRQERRFFLLGTDKFGRDLWSRIIYGSRVSLTIGVTATLLALIVGIAVGTLAGMGGRWIDSLLMRLVDGVLMFPRMFLVLTLAALFGSRTWVVIALLAATSWMTVSRIVRAELRSLNARDWVLAARATGQHPLLVFARHMLPAALPPVLVDTMLRVGDLILLEAALSFLGLGVQPPQASWGNIIADGAEALASAWWVAAFPGLAIFLAVLAFNLIGDGLRDRLDPRMATR